MNLDQLRLSGHRVIDVFPFFNELEILELRLNILAPYVDRFVVVECPQTFSGRSKPLYFDLNKSKFEKWSPQIIHHITQFPIQSIRDIEDRLSSPSLPEVDRWILAKTLSNPLPPGEFHWKQEFFQREAIRKAIPPLSDHDIVFLGDVDEIWNPMIQFHWSETILYRLVQTVHPYWLNNKSSETWTSAVFTAFGNIRNRSLNDLRANSTDLEPKLVTNGGWHFSFQGGDDRIRLKLESYSHQEFNNWRIKLRIKTRLSKKRDILGRRFTFEKSETNLPPEVLALKSRLPEWFL